MLPRDLTGIVDFDVYIPALKAWFRREWQKLSEQPFASETGLLMGCPLWGEEYVDRFFYFCLPSIRAAKNLEALKGKCRLVIFTDDASHDRLWVMRRAIEPLGLKAQVFVIPAEIMAMVPDKPLNKYWLLGTVQQILIQQAAQAGLGFHMLMPDHLYSEEYFPNMLKLAEHNECIAQTSISGDIELCLPELEKWRKDTGELEVPAVELGDLGWRNLHAQTRYNLMNGVDITKEFPNTHFQCWQAEDKLLLYCCHMNAAWFSPKVCREAPVRLHNALDTELPFFVPAKGQVCIPEASDGMTFIELSDDRKGGGGNMVPFGEFAYQCWTTVHWRDDWMPFYRVPNEVPIKPQAEFLSEENIRTAQETIVQALIAAKPVVEAAENAERERLAKVKEEAAMAAAEKPKNRKERRAAKKHTVTDVQMAAD